MKKITNKIKTKVKKVKEFVKDEVDYMREDPLGTLEIGVLIGMGLAFTAFAIGINGAAKKTISAEEAYKKGWDEGSHEGVLQTKVGYENYLFGTGKTDEEVSQISNTVKIVM